jgi:hypothetical protein
VTPKIERRANPRLLDHPFIKQHAPDIADACDQIAAVTQASTKNWADYDAAQAAYKPVLAEWWDEAEAALGNGDAPPEKPKQPTLAHDAGLMTQARANAQEALTNTIAEHGQVVITAALDRQDERLNQLNTSLKVSFREWAEEVMAELGDLAPIIDHVRGLLNHHRTPDERDPRRSRSATVSHLTDGGGVL